MLDLVDSEGMQAHGDDTKIARPPFRDEAGMVDGAPKGDCKGKGLWLGQVRLGLGNFGSFYRAKKERMGS